MFIFGDIGNSETKVFLVSSNNRIIKNINFSSNKINEKTLVKLNKKYLIVGIGINLIKNPYIKNYPTINLLDLTKKKISKSKIENEIKKIFEFKLSKFCN